MNNTEISMNDESAMEEAIKRFSNNQSVGRVLIQRSGNQEITREEFNELLLELRRIKEISSSNNRILMGFVILYVTSLIAAILFYLSR